MRFVNKPSAVIWATAFASMLSACDGGSNTSSAGNTSSSVATTPSSSTQVAQSSSSIAPSSSSQAPVSSVAPSSSSSTPTSVAKPFIFGINAGGALVTIGGRTYMASRFGNGSPNSTTDPIGGTTDDQLFQSELYGETITFNVPVENGDYDIELHFVEMYQTANGSRIFSANVEGDIVFSDLDLYMTEGHDEAYTVRVSDLAVDDEEITITLTSSADNATISGISVYSSNGAYREPPPPPPPPRSTERPGSDCAIGTIPTRANNSMLPDPFTRVDGSRMTSKSEWRCVREEILRMAETNAYGPKPGKPASVSGSISGNTITVNVSDNGRSTSFSAGLSLPSGSGPFPSVIAYGGGFFGGAHPGFSQEGVAVITYDPYDVGNETGGRSKGAGAFYELYPSTSAGHLIAWAWGVSRIIDVMEQEWANGGRVLIPESVAVTGCSRFGKGSFAAGVFDARVALTVPIESGSGGVPIWRGIPGEGAQSLSSAYGEQRWYGDPFGSFTSNPSAFPLDTHQLVAAVAPRGLLILDNPGIANLGPRSASVAAYGGLEVYKALGVGEHMTYHSNTVDGTHCSNRTGDWTTPVREHVKRFLKGQNGNTGGVNARSTQNGNLSQWRNWTTPTLSGSLED